MDSPEAIRLDEESLVEKGTREGVSTQQTREGVLIQQ